jgi:hypothetical protein
LSKSCFCAYDEDMKRNELTQTRVIPHTITQRMHEIVMKDERMK